MSRYHEMDYRNQTTNEFRDYMWKEQWAENTIYNYCNETNKFIRFLNGKPVSRITKIDVVNYVASLRDEMAINKKLKVSSVNFKIAAINKFLKYLNMEDFKSKNIYVHKKVFLDDNEVLTRDEVEMLLKAAKKLKNKRLYWALRILFQTGMRISELEYVTVESLRKGSVDVYNKGGSRPIPIPEDLAKGALEYCAEKGITTGVVIRTRNDKRVHKTVITRGIKKLANLLDINEKKAHPHSLRHAFAKNYLKRECGTLTMLADILGHRSITTTRVYTKDLLSNVRKTMTMDRLGIKIAS